MEHSIHISRNGQQFGPYKQSTAEQYLSDGTLQSSDMAWHEGADGWKPLAEVIESAGATQNATGDAGVIKVTRGGQEIGPYSRDKAVEYFVAGQLIPTDMAWDAATGTWKPVNEVLGLPPPAQIVAPVSPVPKKPMDEKTKIIMICGGGILGLAFLSAFIPSMTSAMAFIVIGIGALLSLGASLSILIKSFQENILWGIGCLLVPLVSLLFIVCHWEETKYSLFASLAGGGLVFVGVFLLAVANASPG